MKQPQQKSPIAVPSSMEVTNVQIGNILLIIHQLLPIALADRDNEAKLDRGVALAADTTFIKACSALDDILSEKSRWSIATIDAMAETLTALYATQAELNAASAAAVTNASRPSFLMKPTLEERAPGHWVAQYGTGRKALKGEGATPHAAMLAFDMAYFNLTQAVEKPNQ